MGFSKIQKMGFSKKKKCLGFSKIKKNLGSKFEKKNIIIIKCSLNLQILYNRQKTILL